MIAATEDDVGGEAQRLERLVDLLRASGYGRDERGRKRKAGAERGKVCTLAAIYGLCVCVCVCV